MSTSALTVLLTASCGGGGSSAPAAPVALPPPPPPVGSSESTVNVEGKIDGFGSVIVNGVRYDTDTASVTNDGRTVSLMDLSVGQIVSIRAIRKDGDDLPVAESVDYEETVEGFVTSVAGDGSSFVILLQTVIITDETIFEDGLTAQDIVVDARLEVSGNVNSDGQIIASYIGASDAPTGIFELHGPVSNLDANAQTFSIFALNISYADAELDGFDDDDVLSNGDYVEVEGATLLNDGTLVASVVELEDDDKDGFDDAEIEGFITAFTDSTDFEVNGIRVIRGNATDFRFCTRDSLGLDVRVEVEGSYNDDGVLVASVIECEVEADIRYEARVDAIDEEAGTITVLGVTVQTDMSTQYKDIPDNGREIFGLGSLVPDEPVQVRAFMDPDADQLTAKRIRRIEADDFDETEVRGFVDSFEADSLVLSGVTITTDAQTKYESNESDTDSEGFFAGLDIGTFVKAEGTETDNVVLAEELELGEDDDSGDSEG